MLPKLSICQIQVPNNYLVIAMVWEFSLHIAAFGLWICNFGNPISLPVIYSLAESNLCFLYTFWGLPVPSFWGYHVIVYCKEISYFNSFMLVITNANRMKMLITSPTIVWCIKSQTDIVNKFYNSMIGYSYSNTLYINYMYLFLLNIVKNQSRQNCIQAYITR